MTAVEELLSKLLHPARLLFVKSDKRQADALQQQIQQKYECVVDWVGSGGEAKHRLRQNKYDLLLLESTPSDMSAVDVLRCAKAAAPSLPVVLVFDYPNEQVATEAARVGVVCGLIEPVKQTYIDDLFRVFKIHVRSCEDSRYFESRSTGFRSSIAA